MGRLGVGTKVCGLVRGNPFHRGLMEGRQKKEERRERKKGGVGESPVGKVLYCVCACGPCHSIPSSGTYGPMVRVRPSPRTLIH